MPELAALEPSCPPLRRPEALFSPTAKVHGLRVAQTRREEGGRFLDVWLYRDPPAELADPALWSLERLSGEKVEIAAVALAAAPTPHLELRLLGLPEQVPYRLEVSPPEGVDFDPLRTWLGVRLRPECDEGAECARPEPSRPLAVPSPVHDYLARDWHSLRRALVEHLLRQDPAADTSVADPTIALIELFAHVGDLLHYRLDRVATEAYLESARLRTSVRRHALLLDFPVGEGAAAEAAVHLSVAAGGKDVDVGAGAIAVDEVGSPLAFTLERGLKVRAALGEIAVYDWGEASCCLQDGATECILVRPKPADSLGDDWLAPGELLAFEVVDPDDAERHRRWARRELDWPSDGERDRFREPLPSRVAQVVELVEAEPFADPLLGAELELIRVRWRDEDALRRSYPVGIDAGAGGEEVVVARANLVPAHHGRRVNGPAGATLAAGPLAGEYALSAAAARGLSRDGDGEPRLAVGVELPSGLALEATAVRSLLDASPGDLCFVVECDEEGAPVIRFRTGSVGVAPPLGSAVTAAYEVGGGSVGNLPANALHLVEENAAAGGQVPEWRRLAGVQARNPVAAGGGADPVPLDTVRRDAPEAFAAEPRRAVLAADHAAAAALSPLVERAMARGEWTGSWPLVDTVVDFHQEGGEKERASVQELLDGLRMIGTEAAAIQGTPVGLLLALEICPRPGFQRAALRAEVLAALRPGSDERPGLFHPSRLQLGRAVYLSAVLAAVARLPGVDSVRAAEARRLSDPAGTVHEVIEVATEEVVVLDDDPARPQRGRLEVSVGGGG